MTKNVSLQDILCEIGDFSLQSWLGFIWVFRFGRYPVEAKQESKDWVVSMCSWLVSIVKVVRVTPQKTNLEPKNHSLLKGISSSKPPFWASKC